VAHGPPAGPRTRLGELVRSFPAAGLVLSRYGFSGELQEEDTTLEEFARQRGVPAGRLLGELGRVAEVSLGEPPPESFLALAGVHEWVDELFLSHQEALLEQNIPLAAELLERVYEGQRRHIGVEEEILLPVYARAGRIPGGDPELYTNEHRKMLQILEHFRQALPRLEEKAPGERRRDLIDLFDRGYWYKRLHEHHDNRERNILYPTLDRVTGEEERRELIARCAP